MNSSTEKLNEINNLSESGYKPPIAGPRRSIRSEERSIYPHNNSLELHMTNNISGQQNLNSSEDEISINKDDSTNDRQIKESFDEHNKENGMNQSFQSQNDVSLNKSSHKVESTRNQISPFESKSAQFPNKQDKNSSESVWLPPSESKSAQFPNKQDKNSSSLIYIISVLILSVSVYFFFIMNKEKTQANSNHIPKFKSIDEIKESFHNQELETWIDISTAINETKSNNFKTPQIILLFANETTTMDCLATALAYTSSHILSIDSPLYLNPENITDAGEIICKLKEYSSTKQVVMIRNVLNINPEAIKALHNLCDKINPLIREAIYIFTVQTNNYQSSQKKLAFVEDHFYRKLSESIDRDILMALVTRITDGAIISVQPEPQLKYFC